MLRGFNRIALEIDPRVREYDDFLQDRCRGVVEELEFMIQEDIQKAQEKAINRL